MKRKSITMLFAAILSAICMASFTLQASAELSINDCTDPNGEEYVDYDHPAYFYGPNDAEGDSPWMFYKIYSFAEGVEPSAEACAKGEGRGVVCERYTGSTDGMYIMKYEDMLATDTEGEFEFDGQTYQYDILSPQFMARSYTGLLMSVIVHETPLTYDIIQNFDMNKDGIIRVDDVVKYNRQLSSTPFAFVTSQVLSWLEKMEPETFFSILDYHEKAGEEKIWIRYGDTLPEDITIQAQSTEIMSNEPTETISISITEAATNVANSVATAITKLKF